VAILGMTVRDALKIFFETLKQLKFTMITITSVLGFAYVANNSGMSNSMAMALTGTGFLFPFFSPILGWLGVFLTGSDTSSNALFGKLQSVTAHSLGIDPVLTVAANATGGVTGKMISPQSIAVGAASVGLVGKESELFRFTFKHSFIMLFLICIITLLQAYVINWIIPTYQLLENQLVTFQTDLSLGLLYLIILAVFLIIISIIVISLNKKTFRL
jgi:lactate permease